MDALELTNRLRAEAMQVSESGLPLEVFPQKVQEIIFNLRQCLFGQHLLPLYPDKTVFLVESEKSAVIASHYMPDVVWLAPGGKNIGLNVQTIEVLRGRDVVLLPDGVAA